MKKRKTVGKLTALVMAGSMCLTGFSVFPAAETQAADSGTDARWEEIQATVGRYYGEWTDTTYSGAISDKMPNTALLGNGDVGVTSGGDEFSKTFYLSKSDFWTYGTGSASDPCPPILIGGVTIGEQTEDVPAEPETDINLAPTYKNVTASSWHDDFTPDKAVNGEFQQNPNGYGWVSKRPQDSEEGGVEGVQDFWLQLEFEEPVTIGRYVIRNDGAVRDTAEGHGNNTKAFEIQVSETGEDGTWETIDSMDDNTADVIDRNLSAPVTTKWVRLYVTESTQGLDENARINPRARIGQFELYEGS